MNRFCVIMVVTFLAFDSFGQMKNFIDQPFVETKARVDTFVTPNEIYLSILVTESDTRGRISVEQVESKMIQILNSLNIDVKSDLSLIDLSSNFKNFLLKEKDIFKSKSYELKVTSANLANKVLSKLEENEISNVKISRTDYSKLEELEMKLKSKAISKARKQAIAMLKPLNQNVGKAIYISDIKTEYASMLSGKVAGVRIRGINNIKEEFEQTEIEFEKIKVVSEVFVNFIID